MFDNSLILLKGCSGIFGEAVWYMPSIVVPEMDLLGLRLVELEIGYSSVSIIARPYKV